MIYSIKGLPVVLTEATICIEQQGITWELSISQKSYEYFYELMQTQGASEPVKIYSFVHSTEKGISLYGFYSLAERSMFFTLQKVDGIGPKAAVKILSHSRPEVLMACISSQDSNALSKIPGIGVKKASKILLALEGVYVSAIAPTQVSAKNTTNAIYANFSKAIKDIIIGLVNMGYRQDDIIQVLEGNLKESLAETDIDEGAIMHKIIMQLERV